MNSSDRKVRVRFAPSPTGPLHIGGVRTALYNYCFAKKHNGDFILRVEDTDQNRFVPGAEQYIIEALKWCGIEPNEGVGFGDGPFFPYKQSERKHLYRAFAEQLIASGHAYYAFDAAEELDALRKQLEAEKKTFQYDHTNRNALKNSLTLSKEDVAAKLAAGEKYVIRIKIPENEDVVVNDLIRGEVIAHSNLLDDKVLYKSDGMPTYHLANVVDDYLMQITHVIRGEEWLPSAPLHVLLYRYLGWENVMPQFAHLPLLLRPDGNGKLSKRDGDRLGFPVFPLQWKDPKTGEESSGYRERGYYPEAVINMLALLGWHPGDDKEIFSLDELVQEFSLERVNKSGAKFDPEKAKWFNQHYMRLKNETELAEEFFPIVKQHLATENKTLSARINKDNDAALKNYTAHVCRLVKEKAHFVNEFWNLSHYLFFTPDSYDETIISKKWNAEAAAMILKIADALDKINRDDFSATQIDATVKQTCEAGGIKPGSILQLLRVCVSGLGTGVDLMQMCELLGAEEVVMRLRNAVKTIEQK